MKEYLEAGVIVNTHGIAGSVMIKSYCDSNEILSGLPVLWFAAKDGYVPHRVLRAAPHRGMVLAALEGIDTPEAAARCKNRTVYAARADLPLAPGAHFIADLIGLPVTNADTGKLYGTVADVINNGASDLYEISTPGGMRYLPAVDEFVCSVDTEKGIEIRPIEGLFDEI